MRSGEVQNIEGLGESVIYSGKEGEVEDLGGSPFGRGTVIRVLRVDSHAFPPEGWAVKCQVLEFLAFLQAEPTYGRDVIFHIV